MRFMNSYDIARALGRYSGAATPNRYAAARTVSCLADWADANSDGWCYWPKPCRSAARLMELLEGNGTYEAFRQREDVDATDAELSAALRPVKAFLTRTEASASDRAYILNGA